MYSFSRQMVKASRTRLSRGSTMRVFQRLIPACLWRSYSCVYNTSQIFNDFFPLLLAGAFHPLNLFQEILWSCTQINIPWQWLGRYVAQNVRPRLQCRWRALWFDFTCFVFQSCALYICDFEQPGLCPSATDLERVSMTHGHGWFIKTLEFTEKTTWTFAWTLDLTFQADSKTSCKLAQRRI